MKLSCSGCHTSFSNSCGSANGTTAMTSGLSCVRQPFTSRSLSTAGGPATAVSYAQKPWRPGGSGASKRSVVVHVGTTVGDVGQNAGAKVHGAGKGGGAATPIQRHFVCASAGTMGGSTASTPEPGADSAAPGASAALAMPVETTTAITVAIAVLILVGYIDVLLPSPAGVSALSGEMQTSPLRQFRPAKRAVHVAVRLRAACRRAMRHKTAVRRRAPW